MGIITTERYPRANDDWEDQAEDQNTWSDCKAGYKKAHAKAPVKAQSSEGADNFGAANAAEWVLKNSEVTMN